MGWVGWYVRRGDFPRCARRRGFAAIITDLWDQSPICRTVVTKP
jgi:hypothetical protein